MILQENLKHLCKDEIEGKEKTDYHKTQWKSQQ
jgi:hypothetical protein